jgi:HAD superfamily hydrolase (TIGR01509 family)
MLDCKAFVFDVDGTLLDSMPIWDSVAAEYLISNGVTPRPELDDELRSIGGNDHPRYFREEYGIAASEAEIERQLDAMIEGLYTNKAPLKVGVERFLSALHERGAVMCVATATKRRLVEPALRNRGILRYFERVFTCDEENTSKHEPDIFIHAADFLGTPVAETIVVEDALYAIKTAKNAGFKVAAVYDASADDQQDEIRRIADYYFASLAEPLTAANKS